MNLIVMDGFSYSAIITKINIIHSSAFYVFFMFSHTLSSNMPSFSINLWFFNQSEEEDLATLKKNLKTFYSKLFVRRTL